ncbi:hypothetical protein HU200_061918 [Digitaria exilis]|uniref:Ubiquitinyl hydrolase 1 n=1 Tax=Digitaria exilis TaxID=1010633 RepID=A0A835A7J1_9POAL|nr:hypothetical protein HU200_061918 [Digitaria exilis]
MCVECNRHLCCGVGAIEYPFGQSRAHAMKKHHWVAVLYDDAERGYCFNCNAEVEMPVEFEVDGHVIGIDVIREVVRWLPDTQDKLRARMIVLRTHPQFLGVMEHTWPMLEGTRNKNMCNHIPTDSALKEILSSLMLSDKARKCDNRGCKSSNSHEFGSANMQDYAIRGIPNIANTCYMNASLQCILALDKLRERLLAPDDRGLYALALAELFEETSAAGGLLNPQKIWTCVCLHNDEFVLGRMSDSQELLSSLRDGLNTEEMKIKKLERKIDAPTFINSIFGFKLSQILSCKCGSNSVSHTEFFFELSLPLPLPSPQTSQSLKSRQKNIAVQLFPTNEQSNFEKMQTVAESDDSHLGSESKEVTVEATPKPLEVDSTEAQRICQNKYVVQDPLQTEKNKVSSFEFPGRIIDVPMKSVDLLPHNVSATKAVETSEMPAESILSIEDCLSSLFEQAIKWQCDKCTQEAQMVRSSDEDTTTFGDQTEQSDRTTCRNEQFSEPSSLSVECKSSSRQLQASDARSQIIQTLGRITEGRSSGLSYEKNSASCSITNKEPEFDEGILPTEKQTDLLRTEHSEDVSKQLQIYQDMMKQLEPYSTACQLKDGKNEQKHEDADGIQTYLFNKLPPVLTLHLKRAGTDHNCGLKNCVPVRFKEYLDVGRFMDPRPVMGDTRPRAWDAGESSRDAKTPRLDLLAATALGVDDSGWEQWTEVTGNSDRCSHVPTDNAHKEILGSSLLSDDAGECADCQRGEEPGKCRSVNSPILVCLECGRQSCVDSDNYVPFGHAQDHAKKEHHWVAAMFAGPQAGFCFRCGFEVPVYPEQEEMSGEIQAGGGAFGSDGYPDLVSGLLNFGDTWYGHEFRSANVQGYAIRGIRNRENTCYVNAILQCLLMLDKLRGRMLGSDAPLGQLGLALKELFVEASAADAVGSMLDADKFLRSIRVYADKYQAYKMHDSYELLESFCNALHNEENEIETPNRKRGDPTVIDSIFRGELSYTRSCVDCGSSSVVHEHFCELSLPLTAAERSSRSSAVPETSGSLKSQPKNIATQLIPANEKSTSEKIQAVPESGDSHILCSEMKDDVVEETPEPLEVGEFTHSCTHSKVLTTSFGDVLDHIILEELNSRSCGSH